MSSMENKIDKIVEKILEDYKDERFINQVEVFDQPDKEAVIDITKKMLKIIFPGFYRENNYHFYNNYSRLTNLLEDVMYNLNKQIAIALKQKPENKLRQQCEIQKDAENLSLAFFEQIPKIREYVDTDVQADFDGDPAAFNKNEIILTYPGLMASTVNRIAHELYLLKVPIIPRMMTEYIHNLTGIDIHPGATIGKYFFIDHGTGIVVGETTVIGEHVKIYQGVTLGALSTRGGQALKGVKRHPTIEDNVTIYSGASIFGGETIIGHDSVIGSNAFITKSICPGSRVSIKNQEHNIKQGDCNDFDTDPATDSSWFYII
ncbi:MAG: serine O-acetyltransferase [Agathobacter sp.]|uniref:serine O-acetyltransferase n=1 Tax=Agathobacter sp. TaxID=2021311 RepID=UPI0025896A0C|nr:serine O-acetyltransferase [Agathobacter sp.]MCR5677991.1 serine O-acetyltransferase [Agathobacter sp.]